MDFYFNTELNLCADRQWIIDYIWYNKKTHFSEDVVEDVLFASGWNKCEVSNTIAEKFEYTAYGY